MERSQLLLKRLQRDSPPLLESETRCTFTLSLKRLAKRSDLYLNPGPPVPLPGSLPGPPAGPPVGSPIGPLVGSPAGPPARLPAGLPVGLPAGPPVGPPVGPSAGPPPLSTPGACWSARRGVPLLVPARTGATGSSWKSHS